MQVTTSFLLGLNTILIGGICCSCDCDSSELQVTGEVKDPKENLKLPFSLKKIKFLTFKKILFPQINATLTSHQKNLIFAVGGGYYRDPQLTKTSRICENRLPTDK